MRVALVAAVVVLAFAPPAFAAPGYGEWTDPVRDGGYNAPDVTGVVGSWDGDWLAFGVQVTQSVLYSGDRIGVQIDANRDGVADYMLQMECCQIGWWLGSWTGNGWYIYGPQSTYRTSFANGQLQAYVHRGEVGWPSDVLWFRVVTLFVSSGGSDVAPNSGWFVLPGSTAVGGVSGGPAEEPAPAPTPAPTPSPATSPGPATTSTPAAPQLDAALARKAIRSMVRRRAGRSARIVIMKCSTPARCRIVIWRGSIRWSGVAKVRVLDSGAHRASFTGTRERPACGGGCRKKVRW